MYKVDHFALEVDNMDRAIAFYTEKLGLKILMPKEYNDEEKAEYTFLELEGGNLELVKLYNRNTPLLRDDSCICPHLALSSSDFDKTIAMLKQKGINIFQGPFEAKNVSKWLYIKDTEGNVLEFSQWLNK